MTITKRSVIGRSSPNDLASTTVSRNSMGCRWAAEGKVPLTPVFLPPSIATFLNAFATRPARVGDKVEGKPLGWQGSNETAAVLLFDDIGLHTTDKIEHRGAPRCRHLEA